MTIDIVDRLRFDAIRCEATFSKGVAGNITEAIAEIERLRKSRARNVMTFRWEVRRQSRWGSHHEKWFSDKVAAIAYVEDQIKGRGLVGGAYKLVDDVFYYSPYPDPE